VDHFDCGGQHLVDSVLDDGVRLSPANLHNLPRPRGDGGNLTRHPLRNLAIPKLGQVLHWSLQLPGSANIKAESSLSS
jgi:hypothetical protein